jgi:PmbA protein
MDLTHFTDCLDKISKTWEFSYVKYLVNPISFESGRLKSIKESEHEKIIARIIKNGKLGFVVTSNFDDLNSFKDKCNDACLNGPEISFNFPKISNYHSVKTYDDNILKINAEEMIKMGHDAIEKIKNYDPEINTNIFIRKGTLDINLINSNQVNLKEQKSFFTFDSEGQSINGEDILEISEGRASGSFDVKPDEIIEDLISKFKHSKKIVQLENKNIPVIFSDDGIIVLLLSLIAGFNGKNIFQKTSPLVNKLGQKIFDQKLSIYDDGLKSYTISSRNFDDEGVPKQLINLVKDGVVDGYLFDLYSASQCNTISTGSGSKGGFEGYNPNSIPSVQPTILTIKKGPTKKQDMIKNIKEGLIVHSVLGLGQGNIISGEFSNNVALGFLIKNGEIIGRVKNVMISGNAYELLKSIDCIGSEILWDKNSICSPYIQVSGVDITC